MLYQIKVYEDGDVYVTKKKQKPPFATLLYLDSIEEVRRELKDYDVRQLDEDIAEIEKAGYNEEVRCY